MNQGTASLVDRPWVFRSSYFRQLSSESIGPKMSAGAKVCAAGNPLTTFVLSEPLAATNLAGTVAALRNRGVSVLAYALAVQLTQTRLQPGAFQFSITGPPGVYSVLASTDPSAWSELGVVTNTLGAVVFTDVTAPLSRQKFYRARSTP